MIRLLLFILLLPYTPVLLAQTDSCGDAGLQLAHGMLWRGFYYPGINLQAQASVQHTSGCTVSGWGFSNQHGHRMGELRGSYEYHGFRTGFTYLQLSEPTAEGRVDNMMLEAELGYSLGNWTLGWSTNLCGQDHASAHKRDYSSYVQLHYQQEFRRLQLQAWAGFTPWKGMYAAKAGLVEVSALSRYTLWQRNIWRCHLLGQLTYAHPHRTIYASLGCLLGVSL